MNAPGVAPAPATHTDPDTPPPLTRREARLRQQRRRNGPRSVPGAPQATVRTSRVVLGHLEPWSVLKVSLLFYLSMFVILLTAGVLLWVAASAVGVIGNIESFMADIGFDDFRLLPGQILRGAALGGLVLVIAGSFGNVLMAVLYNLISDVTGGLRITLAEDADTRTRI